MAEGLNKAEEAAGLHERLRAAVLTKRLDVYTDPRLLDFQGSPVHDGWDHLSPLVVMMCLALAILLAFGVPLGIVAMTVGALAHLAGIKYYVAWRLRQRAKTYMLESAGHFAQLWQLGGVALVVHGGNEPPCLAPRGDWLKYIRRNFPEYPFPASVPTPPPPPPEPVGDGTAESPRVPEQEVLPP